ncbi:MAG: hypothetical protein HRT57_00510 [Crocinitomicaceae bacterium]|nr:hypothetical protein [Crocinitomicaceae bacterium]
MLSNISWVTRIASLVFLVSIFSINWESDRTELTTLFTAYSLAFFAYVVLIQQRDLKFKQFAVLAISAHVISMLFEPNLSNDYYRFLWDGEMAWNSINPFDYKPTEVINQPFLKHNEYIHEIYRGMSDLSQRNYSCYPTISQSYFIGATAFSSSIAINTFLLKLLIVATEFIGAIYLLKILRLLNFSDHRLWILFLNPLWIIECTGNVHFEGVMISFLFIALYFLLQKKAALGGTWLGIAVQIKLVLLIFLPFFLKYLGWMKTIILSTITIGLASTIGLIHLDAGNIANFIESLTLYFKVFEFNSFIFYNYVEYGKSIHGFNSIRYYGPRLSQLSLFLILIQAFWGSTITWQKLMSRLTVAFFIYLLFVTTVHPWYILPILAISLFTNYSFPIIWSLLIFLTYLLYTLDSSAAYEARMVITIEYVIVIAVFLYEIIRKRPLISFLALRNK